MNQSAFANHRDVPRSKLVAIAVLCAVLFFLSLIPLEAIPEIPVDIDQKAFFIPLLFAALLPLGQPTWSVAFGAALGECMRDMIEGYEPDDPIGFVGYVIGFALAGYIIRNHPRSWVRLTAASLLAATVQAAFEASSFLILAEESVKVAVLSWAGNTITHGVIGGILPLLFFVPALHGRIERYMGFAPKRDRQGEDYKDLPNSVDTLPPRTGRFTAADIGPQSSKDNDRKTALTVSDVSFCYPAVPAKALDGVSFALHKGDVLGITGPVGAGKTTLCMTLAGFAPRITGGLLTGTILVGKSPAGSEESQQRIGLVFEEYSAQLTQVKVIEEVMAPLLNREVPLKEAEKRARELLGQIGLAGRSMESKRTWELSGGQQLRLAIAAVLAMNPEVLILDSVTRLLDPRGRDDLRSILENVSKETTLIFVEDDVDLLLEICNKALVLAGGQVVGFGVPQELFRDVTVLERAQLDPPLYIRLAHSLNINESPLNSEEFARVIGPLEARHQTQAEPVQNRPVGKLLVCVENVTFRYDASNRSDEKNEITAVDHLSLRIHEGEVHAVIGPDGAGKTTLARLIAGLSKPESGTVTVCGFNTCHKKIAELAHIVGTTYQNPDEQISERSVAEEIGFPLRQRRLERIGLSKHERYDEAFIANQIQRVCELLEIGETLRESDPSLLPRGLRKLVVMAEAIVLDPEIVILDEPSAGLDAPSRQKLKRLIQRLKHEHKSVALIDHDLDLVCELADSVTVMDNGQAVLQGSLPSVFGEANANRLAELHIHPPRAGRIAGELGLKALTYDQLVQKLARREVR
jgi:energy-coupling factor transporter ATP-binding protein EcfA2